MFSFRTAHAISIAILIATLSQGCNQSAGQSAKRQAKPATPDITTRVDEWVWNAGLFARDKTVADLRKIAPVLRESTEIRISSGQEGEQQAVRILSLYYEGLVINGITDGKKFTLDSIQISSPRWHVPNGLGVGANARQVPSVFGLPPRDLNAPDELFSGLACSVNFTTHAGRISKVSYGYFYD